MTFTSYGYDGTLGEGGFAKMMRLLMETTQPHVVEGFVASINAGTRMIDWTSGAAAAPGVATISDVGGTTTFDPNGTGTNRWDWLVVEFDWSTNGAQVKFVKGVAAVKPVMPALQQDEGVLWQVPLAKVIVRPSVVHFITTDLIRLAPGRPKPNAFRPSVAATSIAHNADPFPVVTFDVPDPGWPYMLQVSGAVNFADVSQGHGNVSAVVDGNQVTSGRAPDKNVGPAVLRTEVVGPFNGGVKALLYISPTSMVSPDELTSLTSFSGFTVLQLPA